MSVNSFDERVKEENYRIILGFFQKNATQIFSLSDLQRKLSFHPRTLKKHLRQLKKEGIVREIFTKPKLRLFQYNNMEVESGK